MKSSPCENSDIRRKKLDALVQESVSYWGTSCEMYA